ncbi:MAG TPA: hypothetical protein VME23_12420 [Terracidiphilus sp.]|nr:hypothetical protein [Terracidiphilus sp.]
MNDHGSSCNEIVVSLTLFYLLERFCAGFMKWGLENGDFDAEFKQHLDDCVKQMGPKHPVVRVGENISPFDTGLMPKDLANYLSKKANKRPDEVAFGKAMIKPIPLYTALHELTGIRNKVMHGLSAPETTRQIASRIAPVFDEFAKILGERLANFSKPDTNSRKVDHTKWSRLLFLTEEELLWIAKGSALPLSGQGKGIISVPIEGEDAHASTAFRRTDRHHKPSSSQLCLPEKLTACDSLWVSTKPFRLSQIQKDRGFVRSLANGLLGLPPSTKVQVSELCEGLDDVESDPFAIPLWRRAPEGQAYICIAV